MPDVSLRIELDDGPWDDPQWRDHRLAGGSVSGTVFVDCLQSIDCRAVRVTVGWRTEGRGDTDAQHIYDEQLFSGQLRSGSQEFRFATDLPPGPISYAGHYIQVVWQVEARLDLAWKRDPKTQQVFYLEPQSPPQDQEEKGVRNQ